MIRWLRCTLLLLLSLVVLAGCDGGDSKVRVSVIYSGSGKGDRSFNDAVAQGLQEAEKKNKLIVTEALPGPGQDARDIFAGWMKERSAGKELVVTVGAAYSSLVREWGCDFGGRHVLHLDDTLPACPTLQSVNYRVFEPSFLAGVAAVSIGPRKTAAAIGGTALPPVQEFARGFQAGVEYAGGTWLGVHYLSDSVAGFSDPEGAKRTAQRLYQQADVIFALAGLSNLGVFDAAKEQHGRYAVGADADQSHLAPQAIIGSVMKRLDKSVADAVAAVAEG